MHYNREMPDRVLRPRSGSSAKSLLLTVLGEFTLTHGGSVWTSTIVDGLRLIGVSERNARQAIARLSEDGLLDPERHGRRTRWHLTESGTQLLKTGTDRIYGFGATGDEWDERWLVVLASVPEDQRPKRHQLRSRLGFAGFGFIGAGIAVSPHTEREGVANTILRDLDLGDNAIVLLAETGTFVPDAEILRRAWDLDILAERYTRFIDEFGRTASRFHRRAVRRARRAGARMATIPVQRSRDPPFAPPRRLAGAPRQAPVRHETRGVVNVGERMVREGRDRRKLTRTPRTVYSTCS